MFKRDTVVESRGWQMNSNQSREVDHVKANLTRELASQCTHIATLRKEEKVWLSDQGARLIQSLCKHL